jgi:hypothetical protein
VEPTSLASKHYWLLVETRLKNLTGSNIVDIIFDNKTGWRAADLMPGEGCVHGTKNEVVIKLGAGGDVELHVVDDHRMTPGEKGRGLKKHFFYSLTNNMVITLEGNTPVEPKHLEVRVSDVIISQATAKYQVSPTREAEAEKVDEDVKAAHSEHEL